MNILLSKHAAQRFAERIGLASFERIKQVALDSEFVVLDDHFERFGTFYSLGDFDGKKVVFVLMAVDGKDAPGEPLLVVKTVLGKRQRIFERVVRQAKRNRKAAKRAMPPNQGD